MIHRDGFLKGDIVEFQDQNFVWKQGTVQAIEWAEMKLEGPNATMVERKPTQIHILVKDSLTRKVRVLVLPKKRVRLVNS